MENQPSTVEPPKRKRRWYQFSLRTVLIFTAVVAIACGACGYLVFPVWRARSIEQEIKDECHIRAFFPSKVFPQTEWLLATVDGRHTPEDIASLSKVVSRHRTHFHSLYVDVEGTKWNDADFKRLLDLARPDEFDIQVYFSASDRKLP